MINFSSPGGLEGNEESQFSWALSCLEVGAKHLDSFRPWARSGGNLAPRMLSVAELLKCPGPGQCLVECCFFFPLPLEREEGGAFPNTLATRCSWPCGL